MALTTENTGFNRLYAKETPTAQWLKEHEHIDGAEDWHKKHVHSEAEKPKAKKPEAEAK